MLDLESTPIQQFWACWSHQTSCLNSSVSSIHHPCLNTHRCAAWFGLHRPLMLLAAALRINFWLKRIYLYCNFQQRSVNDIKSTPSLEVILWHANLSLVFCFLSPFSFFILLLDLSQYYRIATRAWSIHAFEYGHMSEKQHQKKMQHLQKIWAAAQQPCHSRSKAKISIISVALSSEFILAAAIFRSSFFWSSTSWRIVSICELQVSHSYHQILLSRL